MPDTNEIDSIDYSKEILHRGVDKEKNDGGCEVCQPVTYLYARVMHSKSLVSEASIEKCDVLVLPK